jgi:hypothetical protein
VPAGSCLLTISIESLAVIAQRTCLRETERLARSRASCVNSFKTVSEPKKSDLIFPGGAANLKCPSASTVAVIVFPLERSRACTVPDNAPRDWSAAVPTIFRAAIERSAIMLTAFKTLGPEIAATLRSSFVERPEWSTSRRPCRIVYLVRASHHVMWLDRPRNVQHASGFQNRGARAAAGHGFDDC